MMPRSGGMPGGYGCGPGGMQLGLAKRQPPAQYASGGYLGMCFVTPDALLIGSSCVAEGCESTILSLTFFQLSVG